MKIGLISDTHDRLPAIRCGLALFRERGIETLIHPGDIIAPFAAKLLAEWAGTLHVTYGNNDGERAGLLNVLPQIQDGPAWIGLAGQQILVHHFIDWCTPEDVAKADFVITGHTHRVEIRDADRTRLINPGECCGWVTGRCTVGILDLETRETEIIELTP